MAAARYKKDVERFDRWSSTYEDSRLQKVFFDRTHEGILALAANTVQAPESILDVGCGTGKLLRRAAALWPQAHLIGVDPTAGMIEVAQRLSTDVNTTFSLGTAEALPLPDAAVDLAFSTSSFHHWQNQATGLREVARVLRPGGYFFLVDAIFPNWLVRLARMRRFHSSARLRTLFAQAGLQVQTQQGLIWQYWFATVGKK